MLTLIRERERGGFHFQEQRLSEFKRQTVPIPTKKIRYVLQSEILLSFV